MRPPLHLLALAAALALAASPAATVASPADSVRRVLARVPADSAVLALRALEARPGERALAGEAAFALGQLHYARGEFRPAADAFARAAARFEPERKAEARYWSGLAWLGYGESAQARAALEEVVESSHARRADARLALAIVWELQQRPERAIQTLEALLADTPGENAPAALERLAALNDRLGRTEDAARARARLLREFPRSLEAAGASTPPPPPPVPPTRSAAVVLGEFADAGRARALAEAARRAGFSNVTVVPRVEAGARIHAVRLGPFTGPDEARRVGQRAADTLGVSIRIVGAP